MKRLSISLNLDETGLKRLSALQARFAQACLATYEVALANNCFSRVALHHLAYKHVREAFADLGAQLVSNAIYVVSAAMKGGSDKLKPESFSQTMPVVLDRRTVSLTNGQLSIFTLEGRLKIQIRINPKVEQTIRNSTLKEALLECRDARFFLTFFLKHADQQVAA